MNFAEDHPLVRASHRRRRIPVLAILCRATAALCLAGCGILSAQAQSTSPSVIIVPPVVDAIGENHVSILSGLDEFTIPALKMGDVSFTPFSIHGVFWPGHIQDQNYGWIAVCEQGGPNAPSGSSSTCNSVGSGIQAIYGQERATFDLTASGQYTPEAIDGSTFVDNGNTCTWTKRDGTQIVYVAYHVSGNPLCQSNNISEIVSPDGRIWTYYYYGAFSTQTQTLSPILSIATNSGYLLKYNYPGTPSQGAESNVTAINLAFQYCNPTALSCSGTWPTATVSSATKELTSNCDNFTTGANYDGCKHYIFTVQDEAGKRSVFELDSYYRIISYQPPGATTPVYYYTLCSIVSSGALTNCFNLTGSTYPSANSYTAMVQQALQGWVASVTKVDTTAGTSATWSYNYSISQSTCQGCSVTNHTVQSPLGASMSSSANTSGGGTYTYWAPVEYITQYDGTVDRYERNTRNALSLQTSPLGLVTGYGYDDRGNLQTVTKTSIPGYNQGSISESAAYLPDSACTTILTCNKPLSTKDFNGNTWSFTYDPANGEVWTQTGPAVNGVQPQNRYFYAQRNAAYLSSSGMITDTRPIWVLTAESHCISGAAAPLLADGSPPPPGSGCAQANDEVVTSYDYGPSSGPNNLLVRGKTVTAQGQTLRTCYGHDSQVNKIWETSPNAQSSSCPSY